MKIADPPDASSGSIAAYDIINAEYLSEVRKYEESNTAMINLAQRIEDCFNGFNKTNALLTKTALDQIKKDGLEFQTEYEGLQKTAQKMTALNNQCAEVLLKLSIYPKTTAPQQRWLARIQLKITFLSQEMDTSSRLVYKNLSRLHLLLNKNSISWMSLWTTVSDIRCYLSNPPPPPVV